MGSIRKFPFITMKEVNMYNTTLLCKWQTKHSLIPWFHAMHCYRILCISLSLKDLIKNVSPTDVLLSGMQYARKSHNEPSSNLCWVKIEFIERIDFSTTAQTFSRPFNLSTIFWWARKPKKVNKTSTQILNDLYEVINLYPCLLADVFVTHRRPCIIWYSNTSSLANFSKAFMSSSGFWAFQS